MIKVPIWHRRDLDCSFPKDLSGIQLHAFYNGIRKEKLKHLSKPHEDPTINLGVANYRFNLVFKDVEKKVEKYYYPIIIREPLNISEMKTMLHIDRTNLKHIRKKRAKILIVNTMEGWSHNVYFKEIIDYLKTIYNLDYKNFVILSGNMEKTEYGTPIVYYNWWEQHLIFSNPTNLYEDANNSLKNTNRPYKFICLSRRPHAHRIALTSLLYDYRDLGVLTLSKEVDYGSTYVWEKAINSLQQYYPNIWSQANTRKVIKKAPFEYDDGLDAANSNPTIDDNPQKFYDSYLHVVAETFGSGDQTFFSEKIFKPMIYFQPFVLIGAHNDLARLQELGYKTFDGLINESYDTIENDEQRLLAASSEIIRIINMSDDQIKKWYDDCYDILLHNFWHHIYRMHTIHNNLRNDLLKKLND